VGDFGHQLLIATVMVLLTVGVHLVGLWALMRLTRLHVLVFATPVEVDRILVPLGMVLGLFVIHGVEIWAYALLFFLAHAAPGLEAALYVSIGAYSTAGWADVRVDATWRIVLALESVNGLLLVGWSTAFLFQTLNRLMFTEATHPLPEGVIAPDRVTRRRRPGG
jgi:hypothetical protein